MVEEHLPVIAQWFDTWDEFNRIRCFEILLNKCSVNLLQYVKYEATKRLRNAPPTQVVDSRQDFTRTLPRYLCLKIFGYLDPRSLCRCAQVCWYWKYLADSEDLWQTKCSKLGWMLTVDSNSWKLNYQQKLLNIRNNMVERAENEQEPIIETPPDSVLDNVTDVTNETNHRSKPNERQYRKTTTTKEKISAKENRSFINRNRERINRKPKEKKEPAVQPWRPSASKPEDTYFNKFEKILKQKRSERRARSAAPGPRPTTLTSKSPSSTNINDITEFSEWRKTNDNSVANSTMTTNVNSQREVQSVTEYKTDYANYGDDDDYPKVEEPDENKNIKQSFVYETTAALSTLKQNQNNVPWNRSIEAFSDEEFD